MHCILLYLFYYLIYFDVSVHKEQLAAKDKQIAELQAGIKLAKKDLRDKLGAFTGDGILKYYIFKIYFIKINLTSYKLWIYSKS